MVSCTVERAQSHYRVTFTWMSGYFPPQDFEQEFDVCEQREKFVIGTRLIRALFPGGEHLLECIPPDNDHDLVHRRMITSVIDDDDVTEEEMRELEENERRGLTSIDRQMGRAVRLELPLTSSLSTTNRAQQVGIYSECVERDVGEEPHQRRGSVIVDDDDEIDEEVNEKDDDAEFIYTTEQQSPSPQSSILATPKRVSKVKTTSSSSSSSSSSDVVLSPRHKPAAWSTQPTGGPYVTTLNRNLFKKDEYIPDKCDEDTCPPTQEREREEDVNNQIRRVINNAPRRGTVLSSSSSSSSSSVPHRRVIGNWERQRAHRDMTQESADL